MEADAGPDARVSQARRGSALGAAIALTIVVLTGAALTWRYRPDGGGPHYNLTPEVRWSRRLVRWHEISTLVAVPALVIWCVLTIRDRPPLPRRAGIVVGSTVMSIALVALTARAWQRVRWDQLGLWAITVGTDVKGLWYAAFSDDVRFALVPGIGEVPPAELQRWVLVHLLSPVLALAALGVGWAASQPPRSSGPRRSIVAPTRDG